MEAAADEAVRRIDKTPYAKGEIDSLRAPLQSMWVFAPEIEEAIRHFLSKDNTSFRIGNNFQISARGEIWESLCQLHGMDVGFSSVCSQCVQHSK